MEQDENDNVLDIQYQAADTCNLKQDDWYISSAPGGWHCIGALYSM